MDVQITEYRPVQALRPHVQRFWTGRFNACDASPLAQRVVPSGSVECIIHLTDHHCDLPSASGWEQSPDYTLIGLQNEPYEVRFSDAVDVFAIRFGPAAFYSLFGIPLSDLVDSYEDIEAVLGTRIRDFAARIRDENDVAGRLHVAEQHLQKVAAEWDDTYMSHAERIIQESGGRLSVDALANQLSIGRRQLERAFKSTIGMGPKKYMRITRLNLAQRLLLGGRYTNLTEVAYTAGYADQAHFTREFKSFVGHPPSRYLAQRSAYAVNARSTSSDADSEFVASAWAAEPLKETGVGLAQAGKGAAGAAPGPDQ